MWRKYVSMMDLRGLTDMVSDKVSGLRSGLETFRQTLDVFEKCLIIVSTPVLLTVPFEHCQHL